jgi:hypothetical protein
MKVKKRTNQSSVSQRDFFFFLLFFSKEIQKKKKILFMSDIRKNANNQMNRVTVIENKKKQPIGKPSDYNQ